MNFLQFFGIACFFGSGWSLGFLRGRWVGARIGIFALWSLVGLRGLGAQEEVGGVAPTEASSSGLANVVVETPPPFAVPAGFEVIEVASDRLVHDAFCMTMDASGRPVVSGPGYVRTLVDDTGDGIYDRFVAWGSGPKEGAQGLWSEGKDLYWVGDKGLWKSRDANGDLVGDGPATRLFALPTGGEHDAHAIRRGPDGYWYLMVGNLAKGIPALLNDGESFVGRPRAGTLWRMSPDFKTRSVWSHGMRNAYDFDFLPSGEIVTFDSDGERDITLPSYRPTRVFLLTPGSDAGWVSEGWKDNDLRVTMPITLAELGRGSPTGVMVYRHHGFPAKYRDAIFALDWTFGRILCLYPERIAASSESGQGAQLRMGAETFLETRGTIGFAPTDICLGSDGSILVSVGGRGTRGAVYRIVYRGEGVGKPNAVWSSNRVAGYTPMSADESRKLEVILSAPGPLESWSEAQWRPLAETLQWNRLASGALGRVANAEGNGLTLEAQRVAMQILLRSGVVLSRDLVEPLLSSTDADLQSMAWRAIGLGRVAIQPKELKVIQDQLVGTFESASGSDWSGLLSESLYRARLECMGMRRWAVSLPKRAEAGEGAKYGNVRHAQLWAASRVNWSRGDTRVKEPEEAVYGRLLYGPAPTRIDGLVLDRLAKAIGEKRLDGSKGELLQALTLVQAAMGDPRHTVPAQENAPNPSLFDGYVGSFSEQMPRGARDSWVAWLESIAKVGLQQGSHEVVHEAMRAIAMMRPNGGSSVELCLAAIQISSHPTADIDALTCLACCQGPRTPVQTQATVTSLLALHDKVRDRGLNIDNHWTARLTQLLERLLRVDPELAKVLVSAPEFGASEDLLFAEALPAGMRGEARKRILASLLERPTKEWSAALLSFAVSESAGPEVLTVLRQACQEPSLRSTAMEWLAKRPVVEDYDIYLEALASSDRSGWKAAWSALRVLPTQDAKREVLRLTMHMIRNSGGGNEVVNQIYPRVRKSVLGLAWGQPPAGNPIGAWCAFVKQHVSEEEFAPIETLLQPAGAWSANVEASSKLQGDVSRGKLLFAQAKCSQCHGGGSALGPDLAGVSKRFSREDLFLAIYEPSQQISDRYMAKRIVTTDGEVIIGLSVYQATDGITLQKSDGTLARINQEDIERRDDAPESLMPAGLLDGWSHQQIADLYAYIQGL